MRDQYTEEEYSIDEDKMFRLSYSKKDTDLYNEKDDISYKFYHIKKTDNGWQTYVDDVKIVFIARKDISEDCVQFLESADGMRTILHVVKMFQPDSVVKEIARIHDNLRRN